MHDDAADPLHRAGSRVASVMRRPYASTFFVGLLAAVVAFLGVVDVVAQQLSHSTRDISGRHRVVTARPPTSVDHAAPPSPGQVRAAAVRTLLDTRAQAITRHDERAWLSVIDPAAVAFRNQQKLVFERVIRVPVIGWHYDLDARSNIAIAPARVRSLAAPAWLATVTLHYRLDGYDEQPTAEQEYLTFVQRPEGWRLSSDTDGAHDGLNSARDVWDFGPVSVLRGRRTLVLGHPGALSRMREVAAESDRDVPRVTAFWPSGWARHVVVVVPNNTTELNAVVGTDEDLSQIAAVATAETGGPPGAPSPVGDRIVVNPSTFGELGPLGRRIVLTHEITHVATRAATGPDSPSWLVEGIADYVAFKGTGVSTAVAARELTEQVHAHGAPTALPNEAAFDATAHALPEAYEEAWLACRFIVLRTGEPALIAFYKTLGTASGPRDAAIRSAFRSVLHTDVATFTRSWSSYVAAALS